jgi:hypothetical protein
MGFLTTIFLLFLAVESILAPLWLSSLTLFWLGLPYRVYKIRRTKVEHGSVVVARKLPGADRGTLPSQLVCSESVLEGAGVQEGQIILGISFVKAAVAVSRATFGILQLRKGVRLDM